MSNLTASQNIKYSLYSELEDIRIQKYPALKKVKFIMAGVIRHAKKKKKAEKIQLMMRKISQLKLTQN